MRYADHHGFPIITFVDTPGAYADLKSEELGQVVQKDVVHFSWSADHRVIDGATMARAGEVVRNLVESPDNMVLYMR